MKDEYDALTNNKTLDLVPCLLYVNAFETVKSVALSKLLCRHQLDVKKPSYCPMR